MDTVASSFKELFNYETAMDQAKAAAIRELIKYDDQGKTEFHIDELVFTKDYSHRFLQVK